MKLPAPPMSLSGGGGEVANSLIYNLPVKPRPASVKRS